MTKKVLITILLMFLRVALFSQGSDQEERKRLEESALKEIMEGHGPVDFVGRVIDQNGDPVTGALIKYSYTYFCYGHEMFQCGKGGNIITEENGYFEVKVDKAATFYIDEVKADGYDNAYGIGYKGEHMYFKSSPYFNSQGNKTNPAIFQIRKKGEPTILISSEDKIFFPEGEQKSYAICLVPRVSYYHKDILEKAIEDKKRIDLIIDGYYKEGNLRIKVKAVGDKGSGIQIGDCILFSAPEDGYKEELSVTIQKESNSAKSLWVYSKTGVPLLYSRVELKIFLTEKSSVIEYSSSLNPYGERNFEVADYIGWTGEKCSKLENEANGFIKLGKYPPKPDFKALEEEGKKEYLKKIKQSQ